MRLTQAQLAAFHREGYLIVPGVLGQDDLQPVRDEIHPGHRPQGGSARRAR